MARFVSNISFIVTFALIFLGISLDGNTGVDIGAVLYFVDYPSMLIVFLGAISCTLASFPLGQIKSALLSVRRALSPIQNRKMENLIIILDICKIARKNILGIEDALPGIENPLLRGGLRMVVDRVDREIINRMMNVEIRYKNEEFQKQSDVFKNLYSISPAFGMIGTLIGLIILLQNLDDPARIGPAMSIALVTTFYGTIIANAVYLPIFNKMEVLRDELHTLNLMILEGVMLIEKGERQENIEQILLAYFSSYDRAEYEDHKYGAS